MEQCLDPLTLDPDVCPGLTPPPGVQAMDPNAFTLQPYVLAMSIVGLSLVCVAVAIRIYTKWFLLKRMQIEDYYVLMSLASFAAFTGVLIETFEHNCGKHQWNVSMTDTMLVLKYGNWTQVLYSPPMLFAKLALLVQIKRIFTINQKNLIYWISWALIIANTATYVFVFFIFLFACVPRRSIWDRTVSGKCINVSVALVAASAINLVSDLSILALPLLGIWRLRMPLKRKLGVASIFATGALACVACLGRLVYTVEFIPTLDVTYGSASVAMWGTAELTTVILCCCFPTFPRFYAFVRGKDRQTTVHSNGPALKAGLPARQQSHVGLRSPNSYSLHDKTQDEEMGPYTQLDERIMDPKSAQGSSNSQQTFT